MIQEKKGGFVDLATMQTDEYKMAINEVIARQMASIAYHLEYTKKYFRSEI
ncbi:hypothetical protein POV27_04910 [Aureisphaera galaxeae]|uniref:hypothetical protein n=1 Tax=Aureisphaera galaxeae TaxID=1538023 RepID=UPI0023506925|nr:hypothetical protein [Aureisphaera galaxeae]MDC8003378.1 hypothetical protein [Aureisphaera galaxeae]